MFILSQMHIRITFRLANMLFACDASTTACVTENTTNVMVMGSIHGSDFIFEDDVYIL